MNIDDYLMMQRVLREIPNRLDKAIIFATFAHRGQMDKAFVPYILHPLRVMDAVKEHGVEAMVVAVLHDVVEDCGVMLCEIRDFFDESIMDGVDSVSRRVKPTKELYSDFIARSGAHPIGRIVKIADLRDNKSPIRLMALPPEEQGVVNRYNKALIQLGEEL